MRAKDELGRAGEDVAAAYLGECGHELVERNWRCSHGEIDLVSIDPAGPDGPQLVFTEVKSRSSFASGHPLEAVTAEKLARMRRCAGAWLQEHRALVGAAGVRLDVIGVLQPAGIAPRVFHRRSVGLQ